MNLQKLELIIVMSRKAIYRSFDKKESVNTVSNCLINTAAAV